MNKISGELFERLDIRSGGPGEGPVEFLRRECDIWPVQRQVVGAGGQCPIISSLFVRKNAADGVIDLTFVYIMDPCVSFK